MQELSEVRGQFESDHKMSLTNIYLPRLGCGCGKLEWDTVREVIKPILDDRFIVINN